MVGYLVVRGVLRLRILLSAVLDSNFERRHEAQFATSLMRSRERREEVRIGPIWNRVIQNSDVRTSRV